MLNTQEFYLRNEFFFKNLRVHDSGTERAEIVPAPDEIQHSTHQ